MARKSLPNSDIWERSARNSVCPWLWPLLFLLLLVPAEAFGQDRAVMTAPTVRSVEGVVSVVTQFSGFRPDRTYRIGVGFANAPIPSLEIQLHRESRKIGQLTDFQQGFVSHWWGVDHVMARGFVLKGSELPGGELTLEIKIQREDLKRHENMYLFIARDYGSDRFYLEDGSTID
ncbi:MAG TPA: hypothetical protein VMN76_03480 [Acidobacteriota bacterium]|nr:hypothetical protein [Acidobacteriota bacterium]